MKLKFNDYDYHISKANAKDDKMIDNIIKASFNELNKTKLKGFKTNIENQFKKYSKTYTKFEKEQLIHRIVKGIVKEIYNISPEVEDKHLFNTVRTQLSQLLPIVLENEKSYFINSNFLYEPMNAYCLNILNELYCQSTFVTDTNATKDIKKYFYSFLLVNLIRNIRSTLLLLANGDDVHGAAVFRGAIEITARLEGINEDNIDTYIQFNYFNQCLQSIKAKLSTIDDFPEFKSFKEKIKSKYKSINMENLLINGWYTHNGKPVINTTDLIKLTLGKDYIETYSLCSEFVHEDYVGFPYNYQAIREKLKILIYVNTYGIYGTMKRFGIYQFTKKLQNIIKIIEDSNIIKSLNLDEKA